MRAGWLLFMVYAGVGLVALPLDLVRAFLGRPRATITHSEYIKRARGLGVRAQAIKACAQRTLIGSLAPLTALHSRMLALPPVLPPQLP
jgi:hypothetical protein